MRTTLAALLAAALPGCATYAELRARQESKHLVCARPCEEWARQNKLSLPAYMFNVRALACTCMAEREDGRGADKYESVTFDLADAPLPIDSL